MLALIAVHARANAPLALSVKRMERALSTLMLVSVAVHAQAFVLRKQFPKDNGLGFLAAVLESLSTVRYAQAAAIMLITKGFKRERVFSQNSGRL